MRWERLAHELKKKSRGAVQTFDRLVPKVVKKLGSGAYGHVFRVQDRHDSHKVKALKKNFDAFTNSTDAQRVYR